MGSADSARLGDPLPRPLLIVGVPLAGIALTLLFIFLGFPYDRLAETLAAEAERSAGVALRFGTVSSHVGLRGPGIRARDVSATARGGTPFSVHEVVVRPAWSLSWFRGLPAIHLDVDSDSFQADGTLTLGAEPGWNGEIRELTLADLPLADLLGEFDIGGQLAVRADLRQVGGELQGVLHFEARDGALTVPGSPMPIPFDQLTGDLELGNEHFVRVEKISLRGDMLEAELVGTIGKSAVRGREPLDLSLEIVLEAPMLRSLVSQVVRLDRSGSGSLEIGGTLSDPRVR